VGDFHIKRKEVLVVPFKVFSLKMSIAGAVAVPFGILSRKTKMTGDISKSTVSELIPLGPGGEKNSKPHPQNRIAVPLRGSFKNF